ncbi:hypothetical protein I302_101776 [Kwoniella bestiolae CBS 10118]|uniref:Uncharacterized protein n=1 Tax=Kwoniella bestiolae CBS 10118 TaxID=1296100 RepID=A0A1B9GD67_9TREE|nr:hypothetical protein I302_00456 [Kwoniella bestiolae CBS 10118]OCF28965.1 hypothetical protein I302_00456 [Kwoniella bestiolae CBS 10118]
MSPNPILTDDVILLIAQNLQSLNYHKTLSSLSQSSRNNYQLLTPLLYRHIILTDHSLPHLFSRITDIPQEEKHLFFQPIKEEEEDNILPSSLNPTRRLRVQLNLIFKLTIDTNFEDFDYDTLTTISKCLSYYFADLLFPNISRLVFTAKHGTSRRIGLLSSDRDTHHLLRNFLPVACQPKYICCAFNADTPACTRDLLLPLFTLNSAHQETINIHDARIVRMPPRLDGGRIRFGKVECPVSANNGNCPLPDHPKGCEKREMLIRLEELYYDHTTSPFSVSQ